MSCICPQSDRIAVLCAAFRGGGEMAASVLALVPESAFRAHVSDGLHTYPVRYLRERVKIFKQYVGIKCGI